MRLRDWQERYAAFIHSQESAPFAWGSNDCCTFAARAVEAMTGVNPMATAPSYATEAGAARLILRAGDLHALASEFLGASVAPAFAAVGDVVLLTNEGRELLGVCNGTSAVAPGEAGTLFLPMNAASAVWKI